MKAYRILFAILLAALPFFQARADSVRSVKIAAARPEASAPALSYPGRAESFRRADLFFRVSGPLDRQPLVLGQKVRQGEPLMRIDRRDYIIQRDSLAADVEAARAKDTLARTQHERKKKMLAANSISRQEYDAALADMQASDAQLAKAKSGLSHAEDQLKDTVLAAPFDGEVTQISVRRHEMVQAGFPVLRLEDLNTLKIRFSIPARDLPKLFGNEAPEGKPFAVRIAGDPDSADPAATPFSGVLSELSRSAGEIESVQGVLTMKRPEGLRLLPGMSVEVSLAPQAAADSEGQGVLVPYASVVASGGRTFVWVFDPASGRVASQGVRVVRASGSGSALVLGIAAGTPVVAAGGDWLSEGELVSVMNASDPAAGLPRSMRSGHSAGSSSAPAPAQQPLRKD